MAASDLWQWGTENIGTIVTVVSAIAAVLGALASRAETRKQHQLRTEQLRQSIDSASLDWGNSAIETLASAAMLARTRHKMDSDSAFEEARSGILISLSALIDRGRMFFPNLSPDRHGLNKEGAYQGFRAPILDSLVWAHVDLQALTREGEAPGDACAAFIEDCRKLLVSELQAHLDPRRMDQLLGRYTKQKQKHQDDAIHRSGELRDALLTRRPDLSIDFWNRDHPKLETQA
jgi:hypothetical protein